MATVALVALSLFASAAAQLDANGNYIEPTEQEQQQQQQPLGYASQQGEEESDVLFQWPTPEGEVPTGVRIRNAVSGVASRVRTGTAGVMDRFWARWYDDPATSVTNAAANNAVQLGPRVYMDADEMRVCKTYEPKAGISKFDPSLSTIRIPDEMDLTDLSVEVDVSHARIGALKVELEAKSGKATPRKAILKPRGWGGSGENMLQTVFADDAEAVFPAAEGAPFTGSFKPKAKLARFVKGRGYKAARGGTFGAWTLRLTDMGRNAEGRTPVINNWKLNVCGVVNLNREKPAFLSDDIVEAEAQAARTPAPLACPDAQLLDDGRCPPSAIDIVGSMIEGTYNQTYGVPGWTPEEAQEETAAAGTARAQGLVIPPLDGIPPPPLRQAYLDYVERFNAWADTLPKLSNYLESLPVSTWQLMITGLYASWGYSVLECIRDSTCGTTVDNVPETIVIG